MFDSHNVAAACRTMLEQRHTACSIDLTLNTSLFLLASIRINYSTQSVLLQKSSLFEHVSSEVGEESGRLEQRAPVLQLRRVRKGPVEGVDVLAPVGKIVHVDVVFAHVVVVLYVRRVAARMIANHLQQQHCINIIYVKYRCKYQVSRQY